MNAWYVWGSIFAICATVLAMKWSFQRLPRKLVPRGALAQALSFAPLAALSAVCAPEMFKFVVQRGWDTSVQLLALPSDWRLWGGIAMVAVVHVTRASKSATLFGLLAAAAVMFGIFGGGL